MHGSRQQLDNADSQLCKAHVLPARAAPSQTRDGACWLTGCVQTLPLGCLRC